MVRFAFEKILSGEELRDIFKKELGSEFRVQVKRNRIEIVQDSTKACLIVFRENNGRTECSSPSGFMPPGVPRIAILFAAIGLLTLAYFQNSNFLILLIGALILSLLMRLPSQSLVDKVTEILRRVASEA